jgi:hypothetical protein
MCIAWHITYTKCNHLKGGKEICPDTARCIFSGTTYDSSRNEKRAEFCKDGRCQQKKLVEAQVEEQKKKEAKKKAKTNGWAVFVRK